RHAGTDDVSAHHQDAGGAALPRLDQALTQYGQGSVLEGRQGGIERQQRRQVEVVLARGQGLDAQARAVEGGGRHGWSQGPKLGRTPSGSSNVSRSRNSLFAARIWWPGPSKRQSRKRKKRFFGMVGTLGPMWNRTAVCAGPSVWN